MSTKLNRWTRTKSDGYEVHVPSARAYQDAITFCGMAHYACGHDSPPEYGDTNKPVTCKSCKGLVAHAFAYAAEKAAKEGGE